MKYLRIHDWDEHQTYRTDRGQPPWIKVHRELMRKPKWVRLSDAQKGQLVSLWILAADEEGWIPDDPGLLRKLCYMDEEPDLEVFVRLGFVDRDDNVTSERRQRDRPEAEAEAEGEADTEPSHTARDSDKLAEWLNGNRDHLPDSPVLADDRVRQTLYSHYGPPGMRSSAWKRDDGTSVPAEERPRILALTLSGYLGLERRQEIVSNEFDGALRATAKRELGDQTSDNALPFPGAGT